MEFAWHCRLQRLWSLPHVSSTSYPQTSPESYIQLLTCPSFLEYLLKYLHQASFLLTCCLHPLSHVRIIVPVGPLVSFWVLISSYNSQFENLSSKHYSTHEHKPLCRYWQVSRHHICSDQSVVSGNTRSCRRKKVFDWPGTRPQSINSVICFTAEDQTGGIKFPQTRLEVKMAPVQAWQSVSREDTKCLLLSVDSRLSLTAEDFTPKLKCDDLFMFMFSALQHWMSLINWIFICPGHEHTQIKAEDVLIVSNSRCWSEETTRGKQPEDWRET